MKNRLRVAAAVLALAPALTSCRLFRKSKPAPLPAKIPAQSAPARPAPPAPLEPPPDEVTTTPEIGGLPQQQPPELPPPPAPPKKRPSPAGPRVTAPPAESTETPSLPAPQLRPMLTSAQRQELERAVSERMKRAQQMLGMVRGKNLTREQIDLAAQIRIFLQQAEEARSTDLLRANNLAERAEVLAQELTKRLR